LMTNHIASTSRWRLRAGVLGHLAGRALDQLRQAFSGFIVPELAAEAVRLSAQRPVALLMPPAPTVEPNIAGLPEGLPQSEPRVVDPVAAPPTRIEHSAGATTDGPLPVQMAPVDQPTTSPLQSAAKRRRPQTKPAYMPTAGLTAEPAAGLYALNRAGQAPNRAGGPARHAPPVREAPEALAVKPVAAPPTPTEVGAESTIEKPAPVHAFASEAQPQPTPRPGAAKRARTSAKKAEETLPGLAAAYPAAALSTAAQKRAGPA